MGGSTRGRRSPSIPTVNSRPPMYSSTSAGWRYFAIISRATSRISSSSRTTDLFVTPFEVPSATGFTSSGKPSSFGSRSLPLCMTR